MTKRTRRPDEHTVASRSRTGSEQLMRIMEPGPSMSEFTGEVAR